MTAAPAPTWPASALSSPCQELCQDAPTHCSPTGVAVNKALVDSRFHPLHSRSAKPRENQLLKCPATKASLTLPKPTSVFVHNRKSMSSTRADSPHAGPQDPAPGGPGRLANCLSPRTLAPGSRVRGTLSRPSRGLSPPRAGFCVLVPLRCRDPGAEPRAVGEQEDGSLPGLP